MKISVVTPSYNQGRFIQRCIDSVRSQQGVEIEHVILDNCSTDETREHIRAYQNEPGAVEVKIIIAPDKGQTDAINRGFRMATGNVVCWLNTDEYYDQGALSKVVEHFEKHPDVDVVFGDCAFVDQNGKLLKEKKEYFFLWSMLIFYGCFLPSCATFVRRRTIDDGFLLDEEFRVTMDFDWYVRLAKAGYRIDHIPFQLASFTWHEANISSIQHERRREERRLVQDRFSGVRGPSWYRKAVYQSMRYFWTGIRVLRRAIGQRI
ncbi:MAG: glycosyl transferase family 2 [uncultured bacterium]|nr:MAG: glycosyl transferase family 2 [uncultured bacterium]